jgi:hypothetical protein
MLNSDSHVMGSDAMDLSGPGGEVVENDVRCYITV